MLLMKLVDIYVNNIIQKNLWFHQLKPMGSVYSSKKIMGITKNGVCELISSDKVVIFSKTTCPYCRMAKEVRFLSLFYIFIRSERSKKFCFSVLTNWSKNSLRLNWKTEMMVMTFKLSLEKWQEQELYQGYLWIVNVWEEVVTWRNCTKVASWIKF